MFGFHTRREYFFYQVLILDSQIEHCSMGQLFFLLPPHSWKIRARPSFYQQSAIRHLSRSHIRCSVKYSLVKAMILLGCTQKWRGSACSVYLRSAVVPTKPLIQLHLCSTKAGVSLTSFRVQHSWGGKKKMLVNMITEAMDWVLTSCTTLFNRTHSLCSAK